MGLVECGIGAAFFTAEDAEGAEGLLGLSAEDREFCFLNRDYARRTRQLPMSFPRKWESRRTALDRTSLSGFPIRVGNYIVLPSPALAGEGAVCNSLELHRMRVSERPLQLQTMNQEQQSGPLIQHRTGYSVTTGNSNQIKSQS
jgi:hypothetical protein